MKFEYCLYELLSQDRPPRLGALLKIEHPLYGIGYADCHPWPELGDEDLKKQLHSLAQDQYTPLIARSLAFSLKDAKARAEHVSLFEGLEMPPSHFLMTHFEDLNLISLTEIKESGFSYLKIKVGKKPTEEAPLIKVFAGDLQRLRLKLRLDFNAKLSMDELLLFLNTLSQSQIPLSEWIDFLEDPLPRGKWDLPHFRLAADREYSSEMMGVDVIVWKPAIREPLNVDDFQFVVTSYLDHPFGQACAAWAAGKLKKEIGSRLETCGLLSHRVYLPNSFSECLNSDGSYFVPPQGTGFGFDSLLKSLKWKVYT